MSTEPTLPQRGPERRQSQEKSLQRGQPPAQVPGYEPERFLGVGAYGEVWVAVEKNTGRRVAIKFYTHRGGLDWSLLSREVEKLAFLFADRYVVQLIGVGWDSDPPYYIMEYLDQGSLADRLRAGPLAVSEAVEVFRDVATGLVHAHGKGVLHCDLKPANILLDQDQKPRLADFGQSRLSHEQAPALGTLFYMAPEQADLEAVPDARWDVYALGALLYCMLTGQPPHRNREIVDQLEQVGGLQRRLKGYRRMIRSAPPPTAHRQVPGVDRALAEIVDRCLAVDPRKRYPNVQAVLAALDAREAHRARRPMLILGAVGPALLLGVVALFAWRGFAVLLGGAEDELTNRALESDYFAAQFVARAAGNELERRFKAVEDLASSPELQAVLAKTVRSPPMQDVLTRLARVEGAGQQDALAALRDEFLKHNEDRRKLQETFRGLIPPEMMPPDPTSQEPSVVASWFFCDKQGVSTVRVPQCDAEGKSTIGKNYAWRSYFHGGPRDLEDKSWRPQGEEEEEHLKQTQLSAVFQSQATGYWIVAVTTPVIAPSDGKFLGVIALTVEVGRFVELRGGTTQFAVLVDLRPGDHQGMILQHPLLDDMSDEERRSAGRFQEEKFRLTPDRLPETRDVMQDYRDPMGKDAAGQDYDKRWLARMEPITVGKENTGWVVIVQEAHDRTIASALGSLRAGLVRYGAAAGALVLVILIGLWALAIRLLKEAGPTRMPVNVVDVTERTTPSVASEAPTELDPGSLDRDS
ncbi:MAG: serine/threonine protein kinase [Planctomycetota bacterium]|jgi:hypothetical protein